MVFEKIAIALAVMFLCTLIHAVFMVTGNRALNRHLAKLDPNKHPIYEVSVIWLLIMWMFLSICLQATLWALVYIANPDITALPDAKTAFYFSMVTYTSLGYGDIVLTGDWRAMSAIQAANGLIIFGWTTALIFAYIQTIQEHRQKPRASLPDV
jgi:hypothetical protein